MDPPEESASGDNSSVLTFEDEESAIVRGILLLLFAMLFVGLTGNADKRVLQTTLKHPRPIAAGLFGQICLFPWLGLATVSALGGDKVLGTQTLISSIVPGGAMSVFYCTIFNADLELSIVNAFLSTLLSCLFVPFNVFLYVTTAYGADVDVIWLRFLAAVLVSLLGMVVGLIVSSYRPRHRGRCVQVGVVSAVLLIGYSIYEIKTVFLLWIDHPEVFLQVFIVTMVGLFLSHVCATALRLTPPQVTSVAIVCGLQNSGLAMSFAVSESATEEQKEAGQYTRVCYYTWQGIAVFIYAIIMWRKGRTHAPKDIPFLNMVANSYRLTPWEADMQAAAQQTGDTSSPAPSESPSSQQQRSKPAYPIRTGHDGYTDSFVKQLLSDEDRLAAERGSEELCVEETRMQNVALAE